MGMCISYPEESLSELQHIKSLLDVFIRSVPVETVGACVLEAAKREWNILNSEIEAREYIPF